MRATSPQRECGEVVIDRENGTIQQERGYGNDPFLLPRGALTRSGHRL